MPNKNTQEMISELETSWKVLIEEKHLLDSSSPPHFLYSLIEKTVQHERERIVEDMLKVFSDNAKIYGGMRGEFNASAILCIKDYCEAKGIITNKSDINK